MPTAVDYRYRGGRESPGCPAAMKSGPCETLPRLNVLCDGRALRLH